MTTCLGVHILILWYMAASVLLWIKTGHPPCVLLWNAVGTKYHTNDQPCQKLFVPFRLKLVLVKLTARILGLEVDPLS
jgi:hypothetical protein